MLRDTLIALYRAGEDLLSNSAGLNPVTVRIAQVQATRFVQPLLGRVEVRNGSVNQIHVGTDAALGRYLAERALAGAREAFLAALEVYKTGLVARLPTRRPIARVTWLDEADREQRLRGLRSFVTVLQTDVGRLFIMADVCARGEYEAACESDFETVLADRYLPRDLSNRELLDRRPAVDGVLAYLRQLEQDVQVLVPGPGGCDVPRHGVILGEDRDHDRDLLLTLDLNAEDQNRLTTGVPCRVSGGACERFLGFDLQFCGRQEISLAPLAALPVYRFHRPRRIEIGQRRQNFRIAPVDPLQGRLVVEPGPHGTKRVPHRPPVAAELVEIVDLSFSGVGAIGPEDLAARIAAAGAVHVWLDLPTSDGTCGLAAVVRRVQSILVSRGRRGTRLGLEFVIADERDRHGVDAVARYVMAVQRDLLAQRVRRDPAPAS